MLKNKKTLLIILIIGCIVFLIGGAVLFKNRSITIDENAITRYEWMEMLCERSGLTEYQNEEPYYEDVNTSNSYFSYIQSAVEWDVLESGKKFNGDGYASGRFIALTAMKTIGERKLGIYLDTEDAITDDAYTELAIEHELIEKEQVTEGFTIEECEQVLERLKRLYFSDFWRDDYSNVVYQDDVVELSSDDVLQSDMDGSEIVVADNVGNILEIGTVIVFEQETTKLKFAREITAIDADGTLSLSPVELDQVVESLMVSDITELTFDDIVNYYEGEENTYVVDSLERQQADEKFINTKVFPIDKNSEGFKISLSTEGEGADRHLEVQVTDNATRVSKKLPLNYKVGQDTEYSAEIDISKILIGGQIDYKALHGGVQYADVAMDVDAKFTGTIKVEEEKKIPLLKTPVSLGNGFAGVNVQIYLVLSMEGDISLEAEIPVEVSLYYEKDKGFRNFRHDILPKNLEVEANCEAEAKFRLEPTAFILGCIDVVDMEADIGVVASAEVTVRPNLQVCADISVSFPVITISVCGDDDADTLIGNKGWSAEWKIFAADKEEDGALFQSPLQLELHFEHLPDKAGQYVEECTYNELAENDKVTEAEQGDTSIHTYTTQYGDTRFAFDYPDSWTVDTEEIASMSGGVFKEVVVLKNSSDVTLRYWEQLDNYKLGGNGIGLVIVEVTEIADSAMEDFMVGKIKVIGNVDWETGEEYAIEDGSEMYAVIPKDYAGTSYYKGVYYADYLSFPYHSSTYYLSVTPSDLKFTEEEEKEVIAILQSFREVP